MEEFLESLSPEQVEFTADDVLPGQILALKEPPQMGKGGRTVTGAEIPASLGDELPFIPGKNTFLSKDGLKLYASSFGRLTWKGNRAEVEICKEVDGNLTESLNFNGQIKINGNVGEGGKVSATGDVIISGGVEKAEIESGGSVSISENIVNAKISAEDDIKAPLAKDSTLAANGYIILEDGGLSQCTVAGYSVICQGKKGIIVGGSIKAKKEINAASIGSDRASVQTEIKIDQGGRLAVQGTLYPKVKMSLGRQVMVSKKPVKKFTMKIESSGPSTGEYAEPKIEPRQSSRKEETKEFDQEKHPLSVVVSAYSLEEAKRKGAAILGLSHTNVDYRVLKKAGSKLTWLRVFSAGALGLWDYEKWQELYGPSVDGSFSFDNRTDGVLITIVHHRGKGKKITPQNIIKECEKEGFRNIDTKKIDEACSKRITEPVMIGPRQYFKGTVEVTVTPDESEAFIKILPPKWGGMLMMMDDVIHALSEKNVVFGINKEKISEALQNAEFNLPVKVAEHALPEPGPATFFSYQCGFKDGEELIYSDALSGQLLAVKTPPGYGKPGQTVRGKEISPHSGPNFEIALGKSTFASKDKLKVFSCGKGRICWSENRVDVEPVLEVEGTPGKNIDFSGVVNISGHLKEKIKVGAQGDVHIKGDVDDAEIDSGGNVTIEGKISMARVSATGNIKAVSGKDSTIETKGMVIISDEGLINCTVSGQSVICQGNKGIIMGGNITAKNEINAKVIGSDRASIQTSLKVDQGGKVASAAKIYPRVNMVMGRRTMITKKLLKCSTLKAESGGITTSGYEEPTITSKVLVDTTLSTPSVKPTHIPTPPSVIILADSEDEAKRKGAELIGLPLQNVESTRISKKNTKTPIFRVFQAGVMGPWREEEWEGLYGPPQDASFELINQTDGLFLEITPHRGEGKPLEPKEIFAQIEENGYTGIDSSKTMDICKTNRKGAYRIGVMQFTKELGGVLKIEIAPDKTKAFFTIIPPTRGEVLIQTEMVLSVLKERGITEGIKEGAISNALKNKVYDQPVLVAEAVPPQPGKKASFSFQFGMPEEKNR